jgi:dihydroorotate dehydrogenase
VEIGTITPVAQPGNPKPRLFRVIPAEGIVNRMGFNNEGTEQVMRNLKSAEAFHLRGGVLGINIGKNKVTPNENAVSDYRICLQRSYEKADYIAINISSPNTPNLRDLQADAPLRELLTAMRDERRKIMDDHGQPYKPIAVKLAPDLDNDGILQAVDIIVESGMDCVIATNTTINHESIRDLPNWDETGGLSGRPVFERSTECLRLITEHLQGRLPVIASGGVMSGNDAVAKIQAGASLVQLYSGFIYRGPALIADCVEAIAKYRQSQSN